MDYFLHLLAPKFFYGATAFFLIASFIRYKWHQRMIWNYSMTDFLWKKGLIAADYGKLILNVLRIIMFVAMIFFIGKPELVDEKSLLPVEGVDIVIALDVSGSMGLIDSQNRQQTRFEVAQKEAIRFVKKRASDAIGLVIFAQDSLTRSPITHDKKNLEETLWQLKLGFIDSSSTVLARGMLTALNRLRYSKAKSKIIILLTDGDPSLDDINIEIPIKVAQELGVKAYVIGIGSDKPKRVFVPPYGYTIVPPINKEFLERIASETKGKFFQAKKSDDMRAIYDAIDALEKNEHEVPVFSRHYELFPYCGSYILFFISTIIFLATFVWFSI